VAGDETTGFIKALNDTEEGQLLSLAANFLQVWGSGVLGNTSDTQQILDALDQLQRTLESDFIDLGVLIRQQVQLIIENEDTLAMAEATAHSRTASDKLARFVRSRDSEDLRAADTESDLGIQFFLALPDPSADPTVASRTDPFFLPGVAAAGTVRTLVIAAEDPGYRTIPNDVQQIQNAVDLLAGMIESLKTAVDRRHTIAVKAIRLKLGHGDVIRYLGWYHEEDLQQFQFFGVQGIVTDPEDPHLRKAEAAAEKAREAGVRAELSFLGLPGYESLLKQWQAAIA
jgi:hypothetical protein